MTTFFEKLKKGMEIEKTSKESEAPEVKPRTIFQKNSMGEQDAQKVVGDKEGLGSEKEVGKEKKLKKKRSKKEPQKEKIKIEKDSGKKEKPESINENFSFANLGEPEGQLTVDVFETGEDIIIQSAIAGVEPENLDITVEKDIATIKGSRGKQLIEETQNYFRQECYWGKFSREIILPIETDNSRAKAIIKNGILTIKIPKIKKVKIKKLVVEE